MDGESHLMLGANLTPRQSSILSLVVKIYSLHTASDKCYMSCGNWALHGKYASLLPTIATTCTHGSVRLAGGLDPTEGRVEVCVEERWTGVCGSSWNYQDAFVVCRQLGYPATGLS